MIYQKSLRGRRISNLNSSDFKGDFHEDFIEYLLRIPPDWK